MQGATVVGWGGRGGDGWGGGWGGGWVVVWLRENTALAPHNETLLLTLQSISSPALRKKSRLLEELEMKRPPPE